MRSYNSKSSSCFLVLQVKTAKAQDSYFRFMPTPHHMIQPRMSVAAAGSAANGVMATCEYSRIEQIKSKVFV